MKLYEQQITSRSHEFTWCPTQPHLHNFPPCPVIHLNFRYLTLENTHDCINQLLIAQAHKQGLSDFTPSSHPAYTFDKLITQLSSQKYNLWQQVVILLEEYDTIFHPSSYPSSSLSSNPHQWDHIHSSIKSLMQILRGSERSIAFCMITGHDLYPVKSMLKRDSYLQLE